MSYPTPRRITTHHDGHGLAESILLEADERDPNAGGASHYYCASIERECPEEDESPTINVADIQFQHGPRNEHGSEPGIIDTVLLAIVADRLEGFQAGPFAHPLNSAAYVHVMAAIDALKDRAHERAARGVLGKNEK